MRSGGARSFHGVNGTDKMADERQGSLSLPPLKRPRLDENSFGSSETVSLNGFSAGPEFTNDLESPGIVYEVSSSSDPPNDDCGGDSGFHEITAVAENAGESCNGVENGECHQSSGEEDSEQCHVPEADSSSGEAAATEALNTSGSSDSSEQTNFHNSLLLLNKKRDEDAENEDDDRDEVASTISDISGLSDLSDLSGQDWKPISGPVSWVQQQMAQGRDPRSILHDLVPGGTFIPPHLDEVTLWKIIVNILSEPPRRRKLSHVNTLDDFVHLLKSSNNILVLTGAGVSVSSGIPDFRSRNGIYARLTKDFPDLPDPQAMFDIHYFRRDPRPFFKFAKEIYPGQFEPSVSHRFIRCLEQKGKLLRNYSQNIDTLEQAAGIKKVITCHGSFATASCTQCHYTVDSTVIKEDIFHQRIPYCPKCCGTDSLGKDEDVSVMKPNIVFFGEGLSDEFHLAMAQDKDKCDLLIVMGSSLKVRPVALIPSSIPADVPQILINREPLNHLTFDIELLGDCDVIIQEICKRLGPGWSYLCDSANSIQENTSTNVPCPGSQLNNNNHHHKDCVPDTTTTCSKSFGASTTDDHAHSCNGFAQNHSHRPGARPDSTRPQLANERAAGFSLSHVERQKGAVQLPGGSHLFVPPSRYIFYGAEVSTECESELDSCHSDDNTTDPDSELSADCHVHHHTKQGQSTSAERHKVLKDGQCTEDSGCSLVNEADRQSGPE